YVFATSMVLLDVATVAAQPASRCTPNRPRWRADLQGSASDFYVSGIDVSEEALYVHGPFDFVGGVVAPGLAKWDGFAWSALPDPLGAVERVATLEAVPYIIGHFRFPSDPASSDRRYRLARAVASGWEPVTALTNGDIDDIVTTPTYLYTRGTFASVDGRIADGFARWDGKRWQALKSPPTTDYSYMEAHRENVFLLDANFGEPDKVRLYRFDGEAWLEIAPALAGEALDLAINEDGKVVSVR
ncbi:MAG TPA: hypothetical protein VEB21_03325, partial [Terriglobales bacterium]|nr:hypothetical protein [Terriglobales bacterium]